MLDSYAPEACAAAAGILAALPAAAVSGPGAITAGVAAVVAAKAVTSHIFNSESTKGFKQHILREEDANKLMKIVIHEDVSISFESASGISRTVSKYIKIPLGERPVSRQGDRLDVVPEII